MATQTNKSGSTSGQASNDSDSSGGRVVGAFQSARETASSAVSKIGDNPTGALVSGFIVGAVIGAAIPASRREREALQPVGQKITDAARTAARQAAEAGRDKLNRVTGEVVTQVGSKMVDAVAAPATKDA